jgi:hypothetical protein
MEELSFERERKGIYRRPMSLDIQGVTTFSEKLWKGIGWELFPNVGLRHDGLNRLLDKLSDLSKPDRAAGLLRPNLILNIGYLGPRRSHAGWSFPFDVHPEPIVREIVTAIEMHGLPFIRDLSEGTRFREALESGRYSVANQDRDLPALCILMGDWVAAENQVRRGLEKRAERTDPEAYQYRMFAAKLQWLLAQPEKNPSR